MGTALPNKPNVVIGLHAGGVDGSTQGGDKSKRRNEQCGWDRLTIELVEETVLAADERHPVATGTISASLHGPHKRTKAVGFRRVTPTEVVEHGHTVWVAADGN